MILIVDDKSENIISLGKTLEYNGFQVDTAASGEEALRKVLKNTYDLIILDVQMPDMDGYEVAENVLGSSKSKDIPIIFLSAVNTDKRFVKKGYDSGAIDYLVKPVDVDILLLKVRILSLLGEQTRKLKHAEAELTERNHQLHATLQALPQIAYSATAYGKLEYVNMKWYEYAMDDDSWPQGKCDDLDISQAWVRLVRERVAFEKEVLIADLRSGAERYYLWRAVPMLVDQHVSHWVGTFTDIHEQKIANELLEQKVSERTHELSEKNKQLQAANLELQQFTTVASHDLKEPLRKVQMFIDMIRQKELAAGLPELNDYLQRINSSTGRMMGLLDDLLQYSRLSGEDQFVPTDLNRVLTDVLEDLQLSRNEKSADIVYDQLPVIQSLPGQMRQVFQNIISNSLKFSRPGVDPQIKITATHKEECPFINPVINPGPYIRIDVADNGIGFDEKYLNKIFVLFQRLNTRDKYEGTGIGLAVTKKIIENHHGHIFATSRENEGTTFTMILSINGPQTKYRS